MTYLNTGTFTVYIIPSLWRWTRARYLWTTPANHPYRESEGLLSPSNSQHTLQDLETAASSLHRRVSDSTKPPKFTTRETAKLASQFCVLWYLANLFSNASLSYTSVGSSTLLTSTSSIFTLIVGSIFRVEKFSFKKLGALGISILGVALITREEAVTSDAVPGDDESMAWLGNLMALVSALLYGVYTTLLRVRVGEDDERINMFHFFGFVGLFNTALLWPVIAGFDYLGVERFELPGSGRVWAIVLVNAASTIVSDLCWALSMLLTSPLVVTVGLSATIPLALAGDMVLKAHYGTWLYYVGALLVCLSFVVINRQEKEEVRDE